VRRRIWPAGYFPFSNVVAVRNASFARILPNLLLKFARIPALFGGATIAGLAYIQYQATRMLSVGMPDRSLLIQVQRRETMR